MKKELTFSVTISHETDSDEQVICESSAKQNLLAAVENERVNGALTPEHISATQVTIS
ncbi:hypothetical protein L1D14_04405 [Vibrio tubiashii]|uniref:hypothetical protein n=1 Tax=Vibrio tubiashii TaxID=29498 RepID=UPI001EFDF7E6|nr:hypothetical protein [Vibrio tubiashii]MCG9575474.1 hypothetical protein [Vibrio tubiashii]